MGLTLQERHDNAIKKARAKRRKKKGLEDVVKQLYVHPPVDDYYVTMLDGSVDYPFQINMDAVKEVRGFIDLDADEYEKAKSVYLFMKSKGVTYHCLGQGRTRDAERAWREKQGSCFDQTLLYVALARSVGLKTAYYSVSVDYKGKGVNHACAGVKIGKDKTVMVDPAYHTFDINHRSITKKTDREVWNLYDMLNNYRQVS